MIYFNYDPYFCFQRQKVINYLKAGGLIPKGGSGWLTALGRFVTGLMRGVRHPLEGPEKFITIVKEVGSDAVKLAKKEINNLKSQLSKASDPKTREQIQAEIDKKTKELNGLKVGSNEEVISNTAGTAGYRIGQGALAITAADLVGLPAYGFFADKVSPTGKDKPSHLVTGFTKTPLGGIILTMNDMVGVDWPHAVGSSSTETYDKTYDSASY